MDFLKGYKTTIGAVGTFLGGLSLLVTVIVASLNGEGFDWETVSMAGATMMAALAALGIGKKIERNGGT